MLLLLFRIIIIIITVTTTPQYTARRIVSDGNFHRSFHDRSYLPADADAYDGSGAGRMMTVPDLVSCILARVSDRQNEICVLGLLSIYATDPDPASVLREVAAVLGVPHDRGIIVELGHVDRGELHRVERQMFRAAVQGQAAVTFPHEAELPMGARSLGEGSLGSITTNSSLRNGQAVGEIQFLRRSASNGGGGGGQVQAAGTPPAGATGGPGAGSRDRARIRD